MVYVVPALSEHKRFAVYFSIFHFRKLVLKVRIPLLRVLLKEKSFLFWILKDT